MFSYAKILAWSHFVLMAVTALSADLRPIKEIHPEPITKLLPKLGYSPWALVGKTRDKPSAHAALLDYETSRVESLRQENQNLQRQGARCDEGKAQEAFLADAPEAIASALGLAPAGYGGSAEDQAFRRAMIAVHRELRREYARHDMLKEDLERQVVAEAAREESNRQLARTKHAAASNRTSAVHDQGVADEGLSDSTVFFIWFGLSGLWAFSTGPAQSGFIMRWLHGAWVTVLIFVSLGYWNSGPGGAARMLGLSALSAPSLGFIFACGARFVGYGEPDKRAKGRGENKINYDWGYRIGNNLAEAVVAYVKLYGIPVGIGLIYYFS
jgi:hypothetical protein